MNIRVVLISTLIILVPNTAGHMTPEPPSNPFLHDQQPELISAIHDHDLVISNSVTNFSQPIKMPEEFSEISTRNRNVVIAYILFFVIGATGNISVFLSVSRQLGKLKWRITILIVHLSIADLIVTFFLIPSEIFWKVMIRWYGGDWLCKFCQFSRVFGLYLSSMIIICISIDRFSAIIYPLRMVSATKRVKGMLIAAWIAATLFSIPQVFVFRVIHHPIYPEFKQCVSSGFLSSSTQEIIYNVFHVVVLYFLPLLVIVFTYGTILWKINQKSVQHQQAIPKSRSHQSNQSSCPSGNNNKIQGQRVNLTNPQPEVLLKTIIVSSPPTGVGKIEKRLLLRSSDAATLMARARSRTLKLTLMIVLVFVFCYTPYVLITLWYMFGRSSVEKVDKGIQEALFMMAVANSCLNPLVYGNFARKTTTTTTGNGSSWWCPLAASLAQRKRSWGGEIPGGMRCGGGNSPRRTTDLPITSVI